MKLSFSTLGCPGWDLEQVIACAEENGIAGLEIRGLSDVMDAREIAAFQPENQGDTQKRLKQAGIPIIVFGTSCSFHDPEKLADALAEGKGAIDVCSEMGIPNIRVFGNNIPQGDAPGETAKRVSDGIAELCRYGADKGVSVLLEVHGDFNSVEALTPVVQALAQYENFGVVWDIAHSDKVYKENWMAFYRFIRPYTRHVHIKDHFRPTEETPLRLVVTGAGEIPILEIVRRLEKDGYDGYYSLEWEKKWVPELSELPVALESFLKTMAQV